MFNKKKGAKFERYAAQFFGKCLIAIISWILYTFDTF